jgi:hypothetical protein
VYDPKTGENNEFSVIPPAVYWNLKHNEISFYVCKHAGEHKDLLLNQINVWPPLKRESLSLVCGYLSAPNRPRGELQIIQIKRFPQFILIRKTCIIIDRDGLR